MLPYSNNAAIIFIIKWWKKITATKPNPILALCSLIVIVLGICLYKQWTNIPTKTIDLEIYDLSTESNDTIQTNIKLNLNLYEDGSSIQESNTISSEPKRLLSFSFLSKGHQYGNHHDYTLSKNLLMGTTDDAQLLNRALNAVKDFNTKNSTDLITISELKHFINIGIKINGTHPHPLFLQTNTTNTINGAYDRFCYVDTAYTNLTQHIPKGIYESRTVLVQGFNWSSTGVTANYNNSVFSTPFKWYYLEDISKQYLKIRINHDVPYAKQSKTCISRLIVNTVGACETKFKAKEKYHNEISYDLRMDGIDITGDINEVLLYIESKEGESTQNLRMFFLTTLITLFIGFFISSIVSIIKNMIKNKKE